MRTLLIPAAGRSSRYPNMRPKWMLTHPSGKLMIEMVVESMAHTDFDRTVITVLRRHCEQFNAHEILNDLFGESVECVILEAETTSPVATVIETIDIARISGTVCVKDCDGVVDVRLPYDRDAFVVGLRVDARTNVNRIQSKCFLVIGSDGSVERLVEKEIASNVIGVGIYSLSAEAISRAYDELHSIYSNEHRELFFSHIISYLIENQEANFQYIEASEFTDWGTLTEWRDELQNHRTFIIDIDPVLVPRMDGSGLSLAESGRSILKGMSSGRHDIILLTSKSDAHRGTIVGLLSECGVTHPTIVTGCNQGRRVIVSSQSVQLDPWPRYPWNDMEDKT